MPTPFPLTPSPTTLLLLITTLTLLLSPTTAYPLCTTSQSQCLICPIQCTRCDSSLNCSACALQYYLADGFCQSCPDYCLSCSSSTICVQCQPPYVLTNGTCSECVISNAATCSSTVSASSCLAQFYVNSNYCSSCLLNCRTCTSASTCTQCIDTFYLNTTVLTCNPCPSHCLTCNQITPAMCTSCKSGYSLTASNTCDAIDCSGVSHCVYCTEVNVCGRCEIFYYWDGSECKQGASVLCEYGAVGVLPSHCVNDCGDGAYKSQATSPFVCVPYTTVKVASTKLSQLYFYAYSDEVDFQTLSSSSLTRIQLQSTTNEYSFTTSQLNMGTLPSFYKIQLRIKYLSSSSSPTMTLTSHSQSLPTQPQTQSTSLALSPTPLPLSYTTHSVHSNNLIITFSQPLNIIELYLKLHKCPSTCLQCLNTELCELCQEPNYMLGYACVAICVGYYHFLGNRTCLLNCPDGYYYATTTNTTTNTTFKYCEVCKSPCKQCIDGVKCLTCLPGFYFTSYTCPTTCPPGYYPNPTNNTCDNCITPCSTCTSKTTCLTCSEGYWNGTACTIVCTPGTYGNNSTITCEPCASTCLTCMNTSTSCVSCVSGQHLHNKQCVTTCPERYYSSGMVPLTCVSCKPPCEACSSQVVCLTCAYNYFYAGYCVSTCPEGYFENLIDNTCTQCATTCKTCSSANYCSSCPNSTCLYQGQCISTCPSLSWYKVYTPTPTTTQCTCTECKYPCKTCTSPTSCVTCLQGYLHSTSCLTQCPTTYHKNDTLRQCLSCSTTFPNCKQCTQLKCTLCDSGYLLHAGGCLLECPRFYYEVNEKCAKCITPCLECEGFSECASCVDGYILYAGQCVISCPAGKYAYSTIVNTTTTLTQCGTCLPPCLYCTTTATTCTFCQPSYYLYTSSCHLNCSLLTPLNTFYPEPVTSTCTKCLFPCKTCLNQYECLSCVIGYLSVSDGKCKECGVGTYPNSIEGRCDSCPSQCTICYSATYCTACDDTYYLYMNTCISNLSICQQNGYYGIGRICALCQQPCRTCSQSATNCTTCLQGYTFFASLNQCLVTCPTGYFRNSSTSQCDPCASECTTCVGSSTYCFGCETGYVLYSAEMKCLDQCPEYTYKEGAFCTSCKYPCLQCTAETQCVTCVTGSLVGTQCMSSCSSGYFSNQLMVCEACSSTCRQCTSTSTTCTQCPTSTYLHNSTCVSTCPSRTFAQTQSQKCISCMGTCYECSSHINCTSCTNGLYFYVSLTTGYGQCVSSCPNGYYPQSGGSLCLKCLTECLTCTNGLQCLLCTNGKVMHNGSCYTQCPSQMYRYQGVCQPCQSPCYNCSDTMTCTSCQDDSFLLVGSAQCIDGPVCPSGYFLLQNQPKCNSQCPAGYYHLKSNRTCNPLGCSQDQFLGTDYYCYDQCPDNFIANQALYCVACQGEGCKVGLFFSVKYLIRNDDLVVRVTFTETPRYLVEGGPGVELAPGGVAYSLGGYLEGDRRRRLEQLELQGSLDDSDNISSSSDNNPNNSLTPITSTASYTSGSTTLTLTLFPTSSLHQTYFTLSFTHPLTTFQNPLQHSSTTFYLQGYDKYPTEQQSDLSSLGILALLCSLMGLFKNAYMTDYGQLLWILALNNIHYPLGLRSFLESTKVATLHGIMGIKQEDMEGSGKFGYVVNDGLLQNAFGNILIVVIGLALLGLVFAVWKVLEWYVEYARVGGKVSPNEQRFITDQHPNDNHNNQNPSNDNHPNNHPHAMTNQLSSAQTTLDSPSLPPLPIRLSTHLTTLFTSNTITILYINRLIYFNYLPISLFTFTQLSHVNTDDATNMLAFVLAVLMVLLVVGYPFVVLKTKPKFTFLYARKLVTALSLMLSVTYPAYCIGVLSVCNVTAALLITSYRLQKWRMQTRIYAIGQLLQLILMIGFAVFVMIGEGNRTEFKAVFGNVLVMVGAGILLYYVGFALFLLVLWVVKRVYGRDFVQEWIEDGEKGDTDGTDSETMNSSMKDHQEKKFAQQPINIETADDDSRMNWHNIEKLMKTNPQNDAHFIQGQLTDFMQTQQIGISHKQTNIFHPEQPLPKTNELFWNYETNSQLEEQKHKEKQPPKMLIRCVNQFSDFERGNNDDEGSGDQDEGEGNRKKDKKKNHQRNRKGDRNQGDSRKEE